MRDRRSHARAAQFGSARIPIDLSGSVRCALRDRSEGGARLKIVGVLGIPDRFTRQFGAGHIPARAAWRSPAAVGIAFEERRAEERRLEERPEERRPGERRHRVSPRRVFSRRVRTEGLPRRRPHRRISDQGATTR